MIKKTIISSAIFALLNFNIFAHNAAQAAVWQIISSESNKRIEFDKSTLNKNNDTIETLGRVVFHKPLKDVKSGEEYRMIEAVTRYNCGKRTASTIKRIYKRNESSVLREELINSAELPIRGGTLDDKMLNQVCKIANIPNNNPSALNATSAAAVNQNKAEQNNNSNAEKNNQNLVENSQNNKKSKKELAKEKKEKEKEQQTKKETKKENKPENKNDESKNKSKDKEKDKDNNNNNNAKTANKKNEKNEKIEKTSTAKNSKFDENLPLLPTVDVIKNNNSNAAFIPKKVDWSYNGANSPALWADIKPEYKICRNGLRQSPIDVRGSVKGDLEALKFNYRPTTFKIVDTGYTIRTELNNGGNLYYAGKSWTLRALEFRIPGEEMIHGKRGDMSVQLQHQSITGEILIIAIQLNSGSENTVIQHIWNNMPLERTRSSVRADDPASKKEINITDLLPSNQGYVTYMGSLTTPPCTENVQWIILRTPQTISAEQIKSFSFLYQNNARPLQSDNGRMIKESR